MSLFPEQPLSARFVGKQIFAPKPLRHGETFSAFAYQHYVASVQTNSIGNQRDILDVANSADCARSAGRTVHAASIEFNHTFFVRMAAEADALIVRVVL